ncbi:LysR family transcriptional regulator [Ramlibacter ginsenosidimutans]|nr:LysR substrate-binding domain-containing protein [Ramlibacter ginsenosidimutans]
MDFYTSYAAMNTRFDWNLVRSFLAALDHGSLLAAARALGAAQPTIGRHISELERQWGTVLFERTGRGLVPTEAALRVAQAARAMEGGAEAVSRQLAARDATEAGSVRISASQPIACFVMPPLLARMRLALPQVQVELVVSNAVSNLLRREADIALRMVQPQQQSLVARRIGRVALSACAHRDYLARRGTPSQPAELVQHALVAGDRDETVQEGFRAAGLPVAQEQLVLRTDDLIAQWQAVRAGIGIGFVADYLSRADPQVTRLLPGLKIPSLPLWLVVHREIRSNRRIRSVYEFLVRELPGAL